MADYSRDLVPTSTTLPEQDALKRAQARLNVGDNLFSATRNFRLTLQLDGNLVLYVIDDFTLPTDISQGAYTQPIWASDTVGSNATHLDMQDDGNLVLYDDAVNSPWSSGSVGHPGSFLRCQDDGNLVVYNGGWVAWTSSTAARFRDESGDKLPLPKAEPTDASVALPGHAEAIDEKNYVFIWEGVYPPSGVSSPATGKALNRIDVPGWLVTLRFLPIGGTWDGPHVDVDAGKSLAGAVNFKTVFGTETPTLPVRIRFAAASSNSLLLSDGSIGALTVRVFWNA